MTKAKKKILFFFLILFSVYCAITIGKGWDEGFLIKQGEIAIKYLLSFGRINEDLFRREYYSPIYYSLKYLFIQTFPYKFQVEASHLVNLFFSLGIIFGLKKLTKELFNDNVGKIIFLILFFYPIFQGHMGLNSKDTIIALCHVWIFYFFIKYIKKQYIKGKSNNYINYIAVLSATGTGINLFFLGSLIPIFIFILIDMFYFKKLTCKNFDTKKLLIDFFKGFLIFYFLLVIFWIDTHPNIFVLPFKYFSDWLIGDFWRGYPYILLNGNYFIYEEIPKSYLFINLIYKSPEYFLISYLIFIFVMVKSNNFYKKEFYLFNYKLFLIFSMIMFPFLLLYFTPFSIYDGLRHVLWMIPYTCIIPALTIYYLIKNINNLFSKITLSFLSIFIIYFLFNFFMITPYQYTYLNILNGKAESRYKKFENDYWGSSIKELTNKINFDKNTNIIYTSCGIPAHYAKEYLKNRGYSKFKFVNSAENPSHIIMTNRVTLNKGNDYTSKNLTNCFDKFKGKDIFKVTRNGVVLSVIRKIN